MTTPTRRLLALATALLALCATLSAQHRLSVDAKSVQVTAGKKITSERSLYLHPDGRMISHQQRPMELISLTNSLGEMRIYDPASNEVAAMNDKEMASSKEMVALFASGSYVDMGLPLYGYTHSDTRNEGGLLIKSYTPRDNSAVAKVELVFERHLPICMVYYGPKGNTIRKVYFSRYEHGRIPMPMRITEVEYTAKSDSIVRLTTYSNLLIGADASSEMFDFEIPADAKRTNVDPSKLLGR